MEKKNPLKSIIIACMITGQPCDSITTKKTIVEVMKEDEVFSDFIVLTASVLAAADGKQRITSEEESAHYMAVAIDSILAEPIKSIGAYEYYLKYGIDACVESASKIVGALNTLLGK